MADALPANLDWLRRTAKKHLRAMRLQRRAAKLAEAQFAIIRQYGFSGWRKWMVQVDRRGSDPAASSLPTDETVASFLRAVGNGRLHDVEAALVNAS